MKPPSLVPLPPEMQSLASQLADARRDGRQIAELPARLVPPSAAIGYDVNLEVGRLLGWEPLGWKIAGTTQAVRDRLGIDTPIYGRTFRRFATTSPATLDLPKLLDPLVECECFVTLGSALAWRPEPWTIDEVKAAVGSVHAGIEVAECRFPGSNLPAFPAVLADGAASGHYVYGDEIAAWRDDLAAIEVEVELDGQLRRTGAGREVMGDPLVPLLWLAETLRSRGLGIEAGEMISTGSMTGMLPVPRPCRIEARFGASAGVRIEFRGQRDEAG
ncbi:MAG: hydratase [Pseudomonadota bacterium]|nr:hydratase [Pseudomonadota bacterium]